jgi:2-amino-4-hydroxy-6-hydroxymethyldihydropteridine diphosphokinase
MSFPGSSAVTAYVGLGSNLDQPQRQLLQACTALAELPRTRLVRRSSFYRTAPVGKTDQPDFINAVAELVTELAPGTLLQALLHIEAQQGRVRSVPNAARTLDLDLLLFGEQVVHEPGLDVPHPRLHERAFVLVPLAELNSNLNIPGHGTVAQLLPCVAGQDVTRVDAESD